MIIPGMHTQRKGTYNIGYSSIIKNKHCHNKLKIQTRIPKKLFNLVNYLTNSKSGNPMP